MSHLDIEQLLREIDESLEGDRRTIESSQPVRSETSESSPDSLDAEPAGTEMRPPDFTSGDAASEIKMGRMESPMGWQSFNKMEIRPKH